MDQEEQHAVVNKDILWKILVNEKSIAKVFSYGIIRKNEQFSATQDWAITMFNPLQTFPMVCEIWNMTSLIATLTPAL